MIKIFCHGEFYYKTENTKGRKPFVQEIKAPNLEFFNRPQSATPARMTKEN